MSMRNTQFNELIVLSEKARKRGGSMAAVFKLIEELLDFEEKIQACIDAQEMAENKSKIESFMSEIDGMYDILFEMARGGISAIRNDRALRPDGVDGVDGRDGVEGIGTEVEERVEVESEPEVPAKADLEETAEVSSPPFLIKAPQDPKM